MGTDLGTAPRSRSSRSTPSRAERDASLTRPATSRCIAPWIRQRALVAGRSAGRSTTNHLSAAPCGRHGAAPTKESGPCQLPCRFFRASTTGMVASAIVMVARKIVMGPLLHPMIPLAVSVVVRVIRIRRPYRPVLDRVGGCTFGARAGAPAPDVPRPTAGMPGAPDRVRSETQPLKTWSARSRR